MQPFRDFVDQLGLTSHVVIGLDGLDRRDSGENIRRFLQDITPLMGVPGCFFLVTLPEPLGGVAARRRLYLDDVVRMDRLDLRTAAEMVQSRVAGVPKRFAALCYCLSGGVPSDLIRTVRDLVDLHTREGSAALPDVASRLIEEELGYLSAELRMAALGADWDQQSEVDAWVERLARIDASAGSLLETCRGLRSSSSVMKSGGGSTATSLGGLMRRALGLCYVDATLLEIFGQQPSGFTLDDILEAQPPDPSLETLTEARNLLDRGAYATGWRFVSVFREGWGLKVLSAPFADCRDPE